MSLQIKRYKSELPVLDMIVYYLGVICALGVSWVLKATVKKAFAEALQDHDKAMLASTAGNTYTTAASPTETQIDN